MEKSQKRTGLRGRKAIEFSEQTKGGGGKRVRERLRRLKERQEEFTELRTKRV